MHMVKRDAPSLMPRIRQLRRLSLLRAAATASFAAEALAADLVHRSIVGEDP